MFSARAFIFIAIVIGPSCAYIPYNEAPINIFDNKQTSFELRVLKSIELLKGFFNRDDVALAIGVGHTVLKFVPYVGEIVKLLPLIQNTIESRSEWRAAFTKAVKDEIMYGITDSEIRVSHSHNRSSVSVNDIYFHLNSLLFCFFQKVDENNHENYSA